MTAAWPSRRMNSNSIARARPNYDSGIIPRCAQRLVFDSSRQSRLARSWLTLDKKVEANRRQKYRADKGVALEESAIDPGEVEGSRTAMFVNESAGDYRHRGEIDDAELGREPKAHQ